MTTSEEELKSREEKIKHIQDVLEDFMSSKFMKMMKGATVVRSPIRKTNVILKDYNFVTALHFLFLILYHLKYNNLEMMLNLDYVSLK